MRSTLLLLSLIAAGCTAMDPGPADDAPGVVAPRRDVAPAVLAGRSITWEDLRPLLAEAGGRAAMDELVLDRLLEDELRRAGITISPESVEAERTRFASGLSEEVSTPADATNILDRVRRRRGLGPERFERLLRRNAALRALTAGSVEVGEDEIRLAHEIRAGERFEIRVLITATEAAAAAARARLLEGGEPVASEDMAREAIATSIDPTAPRGGLLEPISASDPAWPSSVREALPGLSPGSLSAVIALDRGYAVLYLERRIPATGASLASSRALLERTLRRRKERVASEELARRLLAGADLTVFDASLRWSLATENAR